MSVLLIYHLKRCAFHIRNTTYHNVSFKITAFTVQMTYCWINVNNVIMCYKQTYKKLHRGPCMVINCWYNMAIINCGDFFSILVFSHASNTNKSNKLTKIIYIYKYVYSVCIFYLPQSFLHKSSISFLSSVLLVLNWSPISLRLVSSACNWFLSLLQLVLSFFTIVARGTTKQQLHVSIWYHINTIII